MNMLNAQLKMNVSRKAPTDNLFIRRSFGRVDLGLLIKRIEFWVFIGFH